MIRAIASLAGVVFVLSNGHATTNAQTVLPEANSCTSLQKAEEGSKSRDNWSPRWRVANNCPEKIFVRIAHNYGMKYENNIKCSNSSGSSISPGSSHVFNAGPLPRGVTSLVSVCSQYDTDEHQRLSGYKTCYQAGEPRCPGDAARAPTQSDEETTTETTTQPPGNAGKAAASAPMQQTGRSASKNNTPANVGAETAAKTTTQPPDPKCAGLNKGAICWMEVYNKRGCWMHTHVYIPGAEVNWSGDCSGGTASGNGTVSGRNWGGVDFKGTGTLIAGKGQGNWVYRLSDGSTQEGPYVNDKRHGRWVLRYSNGSVEEGPYVNNKRHGRWVLRLPEGGCGTFEMSEGALVKGSMRRTKC